MPRATLWSISENSEIVPAGLRSQTALAAACPRARAADSGNV